MTTFVFASAMIVIGVVMLVATTAKGGSLLSAGMILGVLFIFAGAARLFLLWREK